MEAANRFPWKGRLALALVVTGLVLIFGARLFGPSELYRFDQPRTASYTVDMLENGRLALPHDLDGAPATKPPLVNWLMLPLVASGLPGDLPFTLVSALATLGTLILVHRHARATAGATPEVAASLLAATAVLLFLGNRATLNFIGYCRPDPLLVFFLTAAWLAANRLVTTREEPQTRTAMVFWSCSALAALTKGPPGLLPLLYLPLAGRLLQGSFRAGFGRHWLWGLPVCVFLPTCWLAAAWLANADHVRHVLLGQEILGRLVGAANDDGGGAPSLRAFLTSLPRTLIWFVERFLPASLLAVIAGIVHLGNRRRTGEARHPSPLLPAIAWCLVNLAVFSLPVGKTADHISPALPAAAVLGAHGLAWLVGKARLPALVGPALGFIIVAAFALQYLFGSSAARKGHGDALQDFARVIPACTGGRAPLLVGTGYNPLGAYLRIAPDGYPDGAAISGAEFVVMPARWADDAEALATCEHAPHLRRLGERRPGATLALYEADAVRPRLMELLPEFPEGRAISYSYGLSR